MSPGDRVDEILKLIDETLAEAGAPAEAPASADSMPDTPESVLPVWAKPPSAA